MTPIFRQLFEPESSTYTYLLADPETREAAIIDPVWQLLEDAYDHCGLVPTLLERDFNIPPLPELLTEIDTIRRLQQQRQSSLQQDAAHVGRST